jgi:hypothetical protein
MLLNGWFSSTTLLIVFVTDHFNQTFLELHRVSIFSEEKKEIGA